MINIVPFDKVMGRIETANNYNRLNIELYDKHAQGVLRYNCGLFVVFKSKSKKIKVKYTVYAYSSTFNITQKLKNEVELLGKCNGEWELLNEITPFGNPVDVVKDGKGHDRIFELTYNVENPYDEYQLCFPSLGRIQRIIIESSDRVEYIKKPLKYIFMGSSVAQVSNDTSHGNICCYLYRHYGINTATVGISGHNTLNFKEMIDRLKSFKSNQLILMDNVRTSLEEYEYAYDQLHFISMVVDVKREPFIELKKSHPEICVAHITGDGRFDISHLNDLGTKEYVDMMKNNNLL